MVKQAWKHAEIHEHGLALKRLAWGFPHGCMTGIFIVSQQRTAFGRVYEYKRQFYYSEEQN